MFSRLTDASKVALAWLVARLKAGDFTLLDCQFMTGHLASLGAAAVSREGYVGLLAAALSSAGAAVPARPVPVGCRGRGAGLRRFAASELPPPDFEALDRLLEADRRRGRGGPGRNLIAQLLGQTS